MLIKKLRKFTSEVLRIHEGEWLVVALLQLQIFLTITVLLTAKPAATGIFLTSYSARQLPWMYLLTAAAAGLVSYLYSWAMSRYSFLRVNLGTLAICLLSLLTFAILEPLPAARRVVAIGLYLWVGVFGVLAASQFWMMANLVFDVRQAKRLFGLIGAGAISGGILGGYLASFLAAGFGMGGLLQGATLILLPCLPISWYLWRHYVPKTEKYLPEPAATEQELSPAKLILGSRHLQLLCAIIALSVITAKLVEFQFSSFAARQLEGAAALTAFFGFWYSTFNVIGLVLQLFFTHRIFQRFGVGNTLAILPAGLAVGAGLMYVYPGLQMATTSRLIDGSLKQSLHRVGIEMLYVPVSPEVKRRVKTYLDVLVDTLAGGLGGLLLLLLVDGLHLPLAKVSVFILLFSVAWLVCVLLMRSAYLNTFRKSLQQFLPETKLGKPVTNHRNLLAGLLHLLDWPTQKSEEDQLLFALERKEIINLREFKRPLLRLLTHPSPAVRAAALRCLSNWHPTKIKLKADRFLQDPAVAVNIAALEFVISHAPQAYEAKIRELLEAGDPGTSGRIFLKLLQESKHNNALSVYWDLDAYFAQQVASLPQRSPAQRWEWTAVLLKAGILRPALQEEELLLAALAEQQQPALVTTAIRAAGATQNPRWLPPLIRLLSVPRHRPCVRHALAGFGKNLLPLLAQLLEQEPPALEAARYLPAIVKTTGQPNSVPLLLALVEKHYPQDLRLRKEVYRALNTLQREVPQLAVPSGSLRRLLDREIKLVHQLQEAILLQRALSVGEPDPVRKAREGLLHRLTTRQYDNISRLFRLLGLKYAATDIIPIYRALTAKQTSHRASALELLDNLLSGSLRKRIIPLLDKMYGDQEPVEGFPQQHRSALEEKQYKIFAQLLAGNDLRVQLAILYLLEKLQDASYLPLLSPLRQHEDPRVVLQVRSVLNGLG